MAQKRQGVQVLVVKNSRNKLLHTVDVAQFNAQYGNSLTVRTSDKFHDRFLVIDKTVLIHVGASLNHLGKGKREGQTLRPPIQTFGYVAVRGRPRVPKQLMGVTVKRTSPLPRSATLK